MSWLNKNPLLSLLLLVLTNMVFGWYISQFSISWTNWLSAKEQVWGWLLNQEVNLGIFYILGAGVIVLIILTLTTPIKLITIFLGSSFKSDISAMISILGWSFVVVLIFCWAEHFARLLLLLSSAIFARFELQEAGYNDKWVFVIVSLTSLGSFALGIIIFNLIHPETHLMVK